MVVFDYVTLANSMLTGTELREWHGTMGARSHGQPFLSIVYTDQNWVSNELTITVELVGEYAIYYCAASDKNRRRQSADMAFILGNYANRGKAAQDWRVWHNLGSPTCSPNSRKAPHGRDCRGVSGFGNHRSKTG